MTEATSDRLRVAFVDDEPEVLDGLRDLLRRRRDRWEMSFHQDAASFLAHLDTGAVDAVVTDVRMPGKDGVALLEEVARRHPEVVRIILSGQVEPDSANRAGFVAHRVLGKPCREPEITGAVEQALEVRDRLREEGLRLATADLGGLPRAPQVLGELREALGMRSMGAAGLARIVGRDVVLTARLLSLVNSAYFGLPRAIVRLDEAITYLGTATVEAVALEHAVVALAGDGLSVADLEAFEAHGRLVGRIARDVVGEPSLASAAFAAGLLHDVGALVLARVDRAAHGQRLVRAAADGPLHVVEREDRGASHADTGGHLLEFWEVPPALVEAVALHHHTDDAEHPPLVRAVGLAEVIAHRLERPRVTSLYRHGDERIGADRGMPVVHDVPEGFTRLWFELSGSPADGRGGDGRRAAA